MHIFCPMDMLASDAVKSNLLTNHITCTSHSFVAGVAGAVLLVTAAFGATALLGFKSSGILLGSTAASMMTTTAVANGGAVPAGSLVAGLQSFAAGGTGTTLLAALGAGIGVVTKYLWL